MAAKQEQTPLAALPEKKKEYPKQGTPRPRTSGVFHAIPACNAHNERAFRLGQKGQSALYNACGMTDIQESWTERLLARSNKKPMSIPITFYMASFFFKTLNPKNIKNGF